ncbi:MAG: hypothetical protein Q9195_007927 [Heterodermia aff. obscurata]
MSAPQTSAKPLQPYVIDLSMLHDASEVSSLPALTGIDVYLSNAESAVAFKAIVQDSTSDTLILDSFYNTHIAGKSIDGVTYRASSLEELGISRIAFSTVVGKIKGEDPLRDRCAPKFRVKGVGKVPVCHRGCRFTLTCFIFDHIYGLHDFESTFPLVIGGKSLKECFLRAQWTETGYTLDLPLPPAPMEELIIYTDGSCLSNGQSEQKMACAGYGIHFPQLSRDWDIALQFSTIEKHTNQRAELLAVIRALQLVQVRSLGCKRISIFTDSMYAVQGLNEWIPKWRTTNYRTAQKKRVGNADLFQLLDQEVNKSTVQGVPVVLSHIPREGNTVADALARTGAQGSSAQSKLNNLIYSMNGKMGIGRLVFNKVKPLVQWSPDGAYWVRSEDFPPDEKLQCYLV